METPCVEQFISSLTKSIKAGYPEFISRLNFSECSKEIDSLLSDRCDAQTASKGPLLRCLLLNFHRQTSLASQSKAALEKEVEFLRAQNVSLLNEVQMANKKAMRYLEDLHSAELDLCSYKEELFKLRSEHLSSPKSLSRCDSGYADSHSSINERLTPHLSVTDTEDTCSLSSERDSAPCPSQSLRHDTDVHAYLSKRGVKTVQDFTASSPHLLESDNRCSVHTSQRQRTRTVACEHPFYGNVSSVSPSQKRASQCLRIEELDLLAKDIYHFDPDNCDQHIEDYFRELERTFIDLPNATQREKLKLVWKTSSKAVHKFIQSLPPIIRNDYEKVRQELIEEFSSTTDEITSLVEASQIKHSRGEHPRDYYQRLRHAYFQGRSAPGLEENPIFKSLFLRNLHPCVRTHVTLMTFESNPSLQQIRKMTQAAWETVVTSKAGRKTTEHFSSISASQRQTAPKRHPHNKSKGGDKWRQRDTERSRHVHQLRQHPKSRSSRRPYADTLTQIYDQQLCHSDDDHSVSEYSLEHGHNQSDSDSASECSSVSGYMERYSPEPQVKKNFKHKSSRVRFSQS